MAKPVVLFMGRDGDPHSAAVLAVIEAQADDVTVVWAAGRDSGIDRAVAAWRGDIIVCFRSHIILPEELIAAAGTAAVNFHPGPPDYRGTGCVNFALYDDAAVFGSTAHLLVREIDAGQILDVRRFPVAPDDTVATLLARTHETMTQQALEVVGRLLARGPAAVAEMAAACRHERWSGPVGRARDLDALMELTPEMSQLEVVRRRRATTFGVWRPRMRRRA